MNHIESADRGFQDLAPTDFAWPGLAFHGLFECLDAAGIDGRLPARHNGAGPFTEPARPATGRQA